MTFRPYDSARDREALQQIFYEAGWSNGSKEHQEGVDLILGAYHSLVAELAGRAECAVLTAPGVFRYLEEDLPLCIVGDVLTGHVARKQGLASRLLALSLAQAAAEGMPAAALGAFEQGFYNQLGFGTGSYDHRVAFDPAQLLVPCRHRPPRRLTLADGPAMHAARLQRLRRHGAISVLAPEQQQSEMIWTLNPFGLGYFDGPGGELTHYIWCGATRMENGPYHVRWIVYRTREQFLELMSVIKGLGDQVRLVQMVEPPDVQLQDLLAWPFKQRQITQHSPYEAGTQAQAWWQMRILDLAACLERTHLPAGTVRFNLRLSDPIERYLEAGSSWRGAAGDYVVTLGPSSGAEPGHDAALPTLTATVNAFTRLWIGVQSVRGLTFTDELSGPPELLEALDTVLSLPRPLPYWDF